jgi:hypothetical protein
MIGALSIMAKQPCLIAVVNDGDEPDLVMVELLQFIPVSDIHKHVVHAQPSTDQGQPDHVYC